ncbi:transferase family-domain-containing protein [Xylaria palmicola]|nr:transferase family-domain-containing protein [Xylaria palmicola]
MLAGKIYICSPLDSIWPPVIQTWILCFPCDSNRKTAIFNTLCAGLAKTIEQKPFLAGRLAVKHGQLQLTYRRLDKTPVPLSLNDLTDRPSVWRHSFEQLRREGMPIRHLAPNILEPAGGYETLASAPIMAQANFIPGGCLLTVCLNHGFGDGPPQVSVIQTWAQNCKDMDDQILATSSATDSAPMVSATPNGAQPDMLTLPRALCADSTTSNPEKDNAMKYDPLLWQLLGLQRPAVEVTQSRPRRPVLDNRVTAIFAASEESIAHLKGLSQTPGCGESSSAVSTFDAEAALIWRCVMRARYDELKAAGIAHSRLRIPIGLRKTLGIPKEFPGNVFLNSVAEMPLAALVAETDGRRIAPLIRTAIQATRDVNRARDAIQLARLLPPHEFRRPLFSGTTAQDLVLTTWREFPFYKDSWGRSLSSTEYPHYVRFPEGHRPGMCAMLPRRGDGEVEVLIDMEREQLSRLVDDIEFKQYFKLRAA